MPGIATTVSFALDERADCVMGEAYGDRSAEAPYSFYPRRAWAAYLEDVDGRRHLDFHNNFAALIHGYGHPQVTRALMEEIAHGAPSFTGPSASEVGLAELLCGRVPALERVRFAGTPAEALAMAVNAARALTGKAAIGRCEGACHGLWARMEAGSRPVAPRRRSDASGAEGGVRLRATPDNSVVLRFNDIAGTEAALLPRKSEIAAVIVDPLPWRLGMRPVARDYLAFLRDFTRRHGAFLISNEVLSFRLGFRGALDAYGIAPDLCVIGNIVGGGFPLGAVAGPTGIMKVFDLSLDAPAPGGSAMLAANPLAMAAGLAAMQALTRSELERLNAMGEFARAKLAGVVAQAEAPLRVTGAGSLFCIQRLDEAHGPRAATEGDPVQTDALARRLRDQGVIMPASGIGALSTPMNEGDIDVLAEALRRALASLAGGEAARRRSPTSAGLGGAPLREPAARPNEVPGASALRSGGPTADAEDAEHLAFRPGRAPLGALKANKPDFSRRH